MLILPYVIKIKKQFRELIKDKQKRINFIFSILDTAVTMTVILSWLYYGLLPFLNHINNYTKGWHPDLHIVVASYGFILLATYMIFQYASALILYPIYKIIKKFFL